MSGNPSYLAGWLVRHRIALFVVMSLLAVTCGLLVPHININSNMTVYLPDDSPMKQGMDLLEEQLPAMQEQLQSYGSVFSDGNDLMPKDLPKTLALGVALLFIVLLIMSSSVAEVLLFLVTVGFAVVLNMGTNALLPSVSMMTNTLSSVLQMVLSMDYSIILMNRYRQEKALGKSPLEAMELGIDSGSRSILSSAFTTVVSLLMLCFIKLKIGADLGIVLAKGVSISLLCNFTVLPALIVWGDRWVEATQKKIPRLPAAALSHFGYRFRWPILAVFLAAFLGFAFLKQNTVLSFSPQWDSNATEIQSGENALLLLYANAEESAVPSVLDSAALDPKVIRTISYPSLALRPLTVAEVKEMAGQLAGEEAPEIPENLLQLVYYAHSHPTRDEKLSFQELQSLVDELSAQGLVPDDLDPRAIVRKFTAAPAPVPAPATVREEAGEASFVAEKKVDAPGEASPAIKETEPAAQVAEADTTLAAPAGNPITAPAEPAAPKSRFTYEQATSPLPAAGMAALLGQNPNQVNLIYRLAGQQKGSLTPMEFISVVRTKVLGNRQYAAFIPKGTAEQLAEVEAELQAAIEAGPEPQPLTDSTFLAVIPVTDSLAAPPSADSVIVQQEVPAPAPVPEVAASPAPPTPQEELMDMALSGRRYSADRIHRVLTRAGIAVSQDQLELLFLYAGAQRDFDPATALDPVTLINYVADTLLTLPALSGFVTDSVRTQVTQAREQLLSGVEMLRGRDYSAAVVLSSYDAEADSTFAFVQRVRTLADDGLSLQHYWVGESQMYKELKDGFPRELLLLTLLTVLSIFLIVALTFRSVLIPIPLVMTVLAGVWANVWASGLGGNTMYYLSYLIIQGILMGATIDYSILYTSYFLRARKAGANTALALEEAYKGASHSILTSGLILVLVPWVMSVTMSDKMIAAILSSLGVGAFAVLLMILVLLPGVLAAFSPDRRNP